MIVPMSDPEVPASSQLENLTEFLDFLHEYRNVQRTVSSPEQPFPENDVEHAYEMAMCAWYLSEAMGLDLDISKLLKYALVHDLVEVYAGDTFSFDAEARVGKEEREHESFMRINEEWGERFPSLIVEMEEYEMRKNPESKFIYALDKILPVITVHLNEGDPFWSYFKLTREDAAANKLPKIAEFPELIPLVEELIASLDESTF